MVGLRDVAVLVSNTLIDAAILRVFGRRWSTSLAVGAMLAQIGEFSFVLAAVGPESRNITDFAHQATIAVITVAMALSPLWSAMLCRPEAKATVRMA